MMSIRNRTIEKSNLRGVDREIKYENCRIINSRLDDSSDTEEYIFFKCRFRGLRINVKNTKRIIFVNCSIRELSLEESFLPDLHFVSCEIEDSKFYHSKFQRITFSNELNSAHDSTGISFTYKITSREDSFIRNSEFIFCNIGHINIAKSTFKNSSLKHCLLEKMEVVDDATITEINLRGTKIFNSNFGSCKFVNSSFSSGGFFVELMELLLIILSRLGFFVLIDRVKVLFILKLRWGCKLKQIPEEFEKIPKENLKIIEKKMWKKNIERRNSFKKKLYQLRFLFLHKILNIYSSTVLYDVNYGKVQFKNDFSFFRYIQKRNFMNNLKDSHPFFALPFYFLLGYLPSFGSFIRRTLTVILLFSIAYFYFGEFQLSSNPNDKGFIEYVLLSIKTFINTDISIILYSNSFSKFLILLEKIFGYFYLGILVGLISSHFYQMISMPKTRGENEGI